MAGMTAHDKAMIQVRARKIWDERERQMPKFVQQTWEQGTILARYHTIGQAARELGITIE
jgi:hypothetical protein